MPKWAYVRRLWNEGWARHCPRLPNLDPHHMPTYYTKAQASGDIKRLLELKAEGWK